jgi:hydrogenase maturation protein HypF
MVQLAQEKGRFKPVIRRIRVAIRGAVQGVGFRPFVYRLASEMNLPGWVLNSPQGVFLEVEGSASKLESFLLRLQNEKPAPAFIQSLEFSYLDPVYHTGFEIRRSAQDGSQTALILPDIATCTQCLSEVLNPANRRYQYPFTNCTNCGPRFTIIESLPYDRPNTSMKSFEMCPDCRNEYENPRNRRFHAQPNACPVCGPKLSLWDPDGRVLAERDEALVRSAAAVREGKVVALKGLGGFLLLADAGNIKAVEALRSRKRREEKPFALMYPTIESILADCEISSLEARLLTSPESPIVLLERRKNGGKLAPGIAPHNPSLGVMLPYTPLHHLLMREIGSPVVATSGNLSDEPICTDEQEALNRLAGIADLFLVHNRPIVRHVDDSIVRIVLGRELVLRRARGYAPLPIRCENLVPGMLAVGGHLKNTIAITVQDNAFISQHIGDLENKEACEAFEKVIKAFQEMYQINPTRIAADAHPDYLSSKFAREFGTPVLSIQHHYAHVAACMAENELNGSVLGVAWDGTGYGLDGTIWGGEFLLTNETSFTRAASFRKFRLPGSLSAIKQPRRTALGVLFEIFGDSVFERKDLSSVQAFTSAELSVISQMLRKGINSPYTSSAGRLFDAVASISGLRQQIRFEGQAAMEFEFSIGTENTPESYPFSMSERSTETSTTFQPGIIVDWEPLIRAILQDVRNSISLATISRKFHNTLVEIIVGVAKRVAQERIVLTGGCFQNKHLVESTVRRLEQEGFKPYWHQRIPPNDGGIALGQLVAASRLLKSQPQHN